MNSDDASEQKRQAALDALDVLDSLEEQAYDDLTRMAASVCQTPIALISLIDRNRQWFKSRVGLDATETPREHAFCATAIQQPGEPLIVTDAMQDARFAHNPLVTGEPGIRFYAGTPLVTSSGQALGTLCVIDRVARELSDEQLETLRFLAQQVMDKLESRRAELLHAHRGEAGGESGS